MSLRGRGRLAVAGNGMGGGGVRARLFSSEAAKGRG